MEIKQLQYFIAIVEEGSLSQAAKRLFMAQPPLSRQISLMEEELGVSLFFRTGRKNELTDAGKLFYQKAKILVSNMNEVISEVQATEHRQQGILAIGTIMSCTNLIMPSLKTFISMYPNINLKLWTRIPSTLMEYLDKHIIELAVVRSPYGMLNVSNILLYKEPFVLAMIPQLDPFYPQTTVSLKDLTNLPMVLLHTGKDVRYNELIFQEFGRYGISPRVVAECSDFTLVQSLVSGGIGATILPKSSVSTFSENQMRIINISDFSTQSEVHVAWLNDRFLSTNAQLMLDLFKLTYKKNDI